MTVYAVWEGEYSAADVIGIFSDKERAEKYMKYYNCGPYGGDCRIEEYKLDPDLPEDVDDIVEYWKVNVCEGYDRKLDYRAYDVNLHKKDIKQDIFINEPSMFDRTTAIFIPKSRADTAEKALKIVRDKMFEVLAKRAGISN